MRAPISRLPTIALLTSLAGCASAPTPIAPPVAAVKATGATADARRAEIRAQIAKVCPAILTPAELDRAAAVADRFAGDGNVIATIARLDRMDREARICRGAT